MFVLYWSSGKGVIDGPCQFTSQLRSLSGLILRVAVWLHCFYMQKRYFEERMRRCLEIFGFNTVLILFWKVYVTVGCSWTYRLWKILHGITCEYTAFDTTVLLMFLHTFIDFSFFKINNYCFLIGNFWKFFIPPFSSNHWDSISL